MSRVTQGKRQKLRKWERLTAALLCVSLMIGLCGGYVYATSEEDEEVSSVVSVSQETMNIETEDEGYSDEENFQESETSEGEDTTPTEEDTTPIEEETTPPEESEPTAEPSQDENDSTEEETVGEPVAAEETGVIALPTKEEAQNYAFSGSGTVSDPYLIQTAQDLAMLAAMTNYLNKGFLGVYFKQTADIDLSCYESWIPIGWGDHNRNNSAWVGDSSNSDTNINYAFRGIYDGGGYTVSNMTIDLDTLWSNSTMSNNGNNANFVAGLFGRVTKGSYEATTVSISNLTLKDATITADGSSGLFTSTNRHLMIGGVVGHCQSKVESVTVDGLSIQFTATSYKYASVRVGGVVGSMQQTNTGIEKCTVVNTNISIDKSMSSLSSYVGLVLGWAYRIWFPFGGTTVNTGLLTIQNNQVVNSSLTAKGNGYRDVLVGAYNPNAATSGSYSCWASTSTCTFVDDDNKSLDLTANAFNLFSGCTINGVDPMGNQDLYNRLGSYTPSLNIAKASGTDRNMTYTAELSRTVSETFVSGISYEWKLNDTELSGETGSSITREAITSNDRLTCTMTFTYQGQTYTVTGTLCGTVIYVDQTNGSDDTGDGTKANPVKTIAQAYELLAENDTGSAETNVIQIVGNYTAERKGWQYGRSSESNYIVFDELLQGHTYGTFSNNWKWTSDSNTMAQLVGGNHVAATLRGDGGVISVQVPDVDKDKAIVQMGDLILENLTIQMKVIGSNKTMSGRLAWYCNGYNLTIGEHVTITGVGNCAKSVNMGLPTTLPDDYKNITIVGCSGMSLPIVAAIVEKDGSYYLDASKLNNTITIASGNISRVIGGARNGDTMLNYMQIWDNGTVVTDYYKYTALYGSNEGATQADTYLWKSTVNVRGTAQVGLLAGGQTDNIFYGTSTITISENAQVGVAVAGSIGYSADTIKQWCDNQTNSIYYSDIKGSCELTLKDSATVYMMYGGSLGRNNHAYATPSCAMRGDSVTLNIEGGTVTTNIYGGGAGGTMGTFSNESADAEKGFGTVTKACNVYINMTGGTVEGNIFGGGDGYYEFALQKLNRHAGWIAGNVTVTLSGGTVKGNVYGGGQGVAPDLTEDVRVQSGITLSSLYSADSVKAKFARISGNTTVTVKDNAVVEGTVYGGGQRGSIYGTVTLNIEGGTVNRAMGSNHLAGTLWDDVTVNLTGGTVGALYGGGEEADYVGTNSKNKIVMNLTGGTATTIYGGGRYATVSKVTINLKGTTIQRISEDGLSGQTLVQRAAINGCLIGAGFSGHTENVIMNLDYGTIEGSIYGGSMFGSAGEVTINYGTDASQSLIMTGTGFDQAVEADASISAHIPLGNLYGGGYGFAYDEGHESTSTTGYTKSVTVNLFSGSVGRNVFGGGYNGYTKETKVNVYSDFSLTGVIGDSLTNSRGYLFGGGYNGAVGDAYVNISGGSLGGNVYGGGYSAATNSTQVMISGGTFSGSIFGGGYAGEVTTSTQVTLKDHEDGQASTNTDPLIVKGSVFGAGEGTTGTVLGSTNVVIDIYDSFTVQETNPSDDTSGRIITTVVGGGGGYGIIEGSVFGGGDQGQVGKSGTDQNGNASGKMGSTTVTVKNGHIQGSVFGGGDGNDPRSSVNYEEEGAVYGTTLVNIWGGYIEGNVYGGGNQARIHGPATNGTVDGAGEQGGTNDTLTYASRVILDQNHKDEGASGLIAIGGSVFGGGDQGAGTTSSASVNTTYGDVKVELIGDKNTSATTNYEATIYFVTQDEHDDNGNTVVSSHSSGGIYGEGNLCLVDGNKYLYLENLVVSENLSSNSNLTRDAVDSVEGGQKIKTIYSFQRADKVTLNHTQIALLGALDLTVDGDDTVYSINRAGSLVMKNGSTIKLYHIVNYLGALSSDVLADRQFIYKGNNGSNQYTEANPTGALTDTEITNYIAATGDFAGVQKNVVCVANGLYLEVKDLLADKTENPNGYGPVTGLFTLQLTNANPGEGGGYVYADIDTSTGDFICETKVQTDGDTYMPVVDDVGGYRNGAYTYYYWYISGTSIFNRLTINGYIESQETVFSDSRMIPRHTEELNYHLASLTGNDTLTAALKRGDYVLVANQKDLTGKEIALEVKLGDTSLGFLGYDEDTGKWYLVQNGNRKSADDLNKNGAILYTGVIDNTNDSLSLNLYLSNGVTVETLGLGVDFTLKMYRVEDNGNADVDNYGGTKELSFSATVNILHMVPLQSAYVTSGRHYEGVETSSDVRITSGSSFTVSFETKYVPAQIETEGDLTWALTLTNDTYYMDSSTGVFLTVRDGTAVNCTKDYRYVETDTNSVLTIYSKSDGYYYRDGEGTEHTLSLSTSVSNSKLPKGTKITLVDYTNGEKPGYYYYVCEDEVTTSINLMDFMEMGTDTTIANLVENGKSVTFVTAAQDKTSRVSVEENLVFVFDFEDCGDLDYTGTLHLSHLYTPNTTEFSAQVDIMDYRKADYQVEITNEVTTYYTRSYPTTISYQITKQTDGIAEFKAGFVEKTVTEGENPLIQITLDEETYWENTRITEGTLALRLTLTDENGEKISLPNDVTFQIGNAVYMPQTDENGVRTVSLSVTGQRSFQIQVNDPWGSLEAQSDGSVHFQMDLVAAQSDQGNSIYYDYLTLRTVSTSYVTIQLAEFALNVTAAEDGDQILMPGDTLSFLVDTQVSEESDQKVELSLEQKTESGYTALQVDTLFSGQLTLQQQANEEEDAVFVTDDQQTTLTVTWKGSGVLKNDAEPGTYRLVVCYGDRTEYLNFIVYTD